MKFRRVLSASVIVCAIVGAGVVVSAPAIRTADAHAQARAVGVTSRVFPQDPQPGQDLRISVAVSACPVGPAIIEAYLTFGQSSARSVALMAKGRADETLGGLHRGELFIPKAFEGWYGIRVVCGTFVPDQVPMANTLFGVGKQTERTARTNSPVVTDGGSLTLEGVGCPGATVEWDIDKTGFSQAPFQTEGVVPVGTDQKWSTTLNFDKNLGLGKTEVRARCVLVNQYGTNVYVYYGDRIDVEIVAGPTGAT